MTVESGAAAMVIVGVQPIAEACDAFGLSKIGAGTLRHTAANDVSRCGDVSTSTASREPILSGASLRDYRFAASSCSAPRRASR